MLDALGQRVASLRRRSRDPRRQFATVVEEAGCRLALGQNTDPMGRRDMKRAEKAALPPQLSLIYVNMVRRIESKGFVFEYVVDQADRASRGHCWISARRP
jgi:hypothetical protein